MQVSRVKDFVERVVWTAVQAFAAVAIVELASDDVDWGNVVKVAGIAALIAALKVVAAQQFGSTPSGDAIPGTIYEDKP
jgi:hypothetical protein